MEPIKDITSLEAFQDFKRAEKNLSDYRKKREQMERKISQLFSQHKAKLQQDAANFKEAEELKAEAEALKQEATQKQEELDTFIADSPNYANQRHFAMQELKEGSGIELINNLRERAQAEIEDAVKCLAAIHRSKEKFQPNNNNWIKNVDFVRGDLESVKNRLQ